MRFSAIHALIGGAGLSWADSVRVGDYTQPTQYRVFYSYWNTSSINTDEQVPYFVLEMKDARDNLIATQACGVRPQTWGAGWLSDGWVSPSNKLIITKVSSTGARERQPFKQTLVASGSREAAGFVYKYDVSGFRLEMTSVPDNGELQVEDEVELAENKPDFQWPEQAETSDRYKVAVRIEGSTSNTNRVTVVRWGPGTKNRVSIYNVDFPNRIPHDGTLSKGQKVIAYPMSRPGNGCEFHVGASGDEIGALVVRKCKLDTTYNDAWTNHWIVFTSVKVA